MGETTWGNEDMNWKINQGKSNLEVNMKRNSVKTKKVACPYSCFLLGALVLSLVLLGNLSAVAGVDERDTEESLTPALIIIEGVGTSPEGEVGLDLSRKLVMNDFGITVGITPYLDQKELTGSEYLVEELRDLYDRYPDKIGFALQGLEHLENELNRPLPEQVHILSRAQSIFTQAFNKKFGYGLLATTLLPPYGHYGTDTASAARQAGIKIIIGSEVNGREGYAMLEHGVAQIHPDDNAGIIADWESLEIRSPVELIRSTTGALKGSSLEDPLVMIINVGILYNELGVQDTKSYIDTLIPLLVQLREREELEFMTSAEFYRKFVGGKQYVVLRLDDYQSPYKKGLFEETVDWITQLGVPLVISIIPHAVDKLSEDPEAVTYLNSVLETGLVEVALHGYDHREEGEFTLSLSEQIQLLREALAESKNTLYYDEIFSLVPPNNRSNDFTSKAIETVNEEGHGVQVFSSGISDKYLFGFDLEGIYHVSRTIDPVKSWELPYPLYSADEITAAIGYDDAVLNLHPYTLRTQEGRSIILEVIKQLKEKPNVEFVTLREFYSNVDPTLGVHWRPEYTLKPVSEAQGVSSSLIFLLMALILAGL